MLDKFLLGGYTSNNYTPNNQSQGIYTATLDTDKGKLDDISLVTQIDDPAFFNYSIKDHKIAVVMTKNDEIGGVGIIDINPTTGQGKLISESMLDQSVKGSYEAYNYFDHLYYWNELKYTVPSYVYLDDQRKMVFAANYNTNAIFTWKLDENYNFIQSHRYPIEGRGPKAVQDAAHIHYTRLLPDGRLIVCALGADKIMIFDVNDDASLNQVSEFKTKAGFGPRQLAFNSNTNNYIYILNEVGSKTGVVNYDSQTGKLSRIADYSNIPEGYAGHNQSAGIRVSADGKFVYSSNRGHDSLAVYKVIDEGAHLEKIQTIKTGGVAPRDFDLSKNGDYLLCANQMSNNLVLFKRDTKDGYLSIAQTDIKHDACVRVLEATDFFS
ncbi:MAG: lactonase family protein [Lactobacillus sp.]|uniref:lactonase family protein n=1 Tax=Bombilactobacillus bombi TaxID=1303590 RepID=UPI0035F0878B|nr:lactonase family protein [Lactobacillus sp.]